jgi:hypothetical protein
LAPRAGNTRGMKHSVKTRAKLSARVAAWWTPERKTVMSTRVAATWTTWSESQRCAVLKNLDGTGRRATAATRKKRSASAKRQWASLTGSQRLHTAVARKKMSESQRGRRHSAATRKKISAAANRRWAAYHEQRAA